MKRFLDIRGQGTHARFCWFDTRVSQIETHSGNTVWDTWQDFVDDYTGHELYRYARLAPDWTRMDATEDEEACFDYDMPNPYGSAAAWTMATPGLDTGIKDRTGRNVRLGDTVMFDTAKFGAPCRWTVEFKDGELTTYGVLEDWPEYVTIVKPFEWGDADAQPYKTGSGHS